MKVLVVDPSRVHRRTLVHALANIGFKEAQEAASTEGARTYLAAQAFDLIALEWNMEGRAAFDLVNDIRSDARHEHTPVVVVTDNASPADVIGALRAGVDEYVIRPFHFDVLKEKVGALTMVG